MMITGETGGMMIPLCPELSSCWFLISLIPGMENRVAIPLGISLGFDMFTVVFISSLLSALAGISLYFLLSPIATFFHVEEYLSFVRKRFEPYRRYGVLALPLFVAVPLPGSGAYTGAVAAFITGIGWKETVLGIVLGTLIAGLIVGGLAEGLLALIL